MADPGLRIDPTSAREQCGGCAYRVPCIAVNEGRDISAMLSQVYRRRPPIEIEEGRLGGVTWSMNRGAPPRFGNGPRRR